MKVRHENRAFLPLMTMTRLPVFRPRLFASADDVRSFVESSQFLNRQSLVALTSYPLGLYRPMRRHMLLYARRTTAYHAKGSDYGFDQGNR